MVLTKLFREFFESEKASGVFLIACTVASLLVANSPMGAGYQEFWHSKIIGRSLEFWINDGLMTIFFLLVGLEIEREIYIGELAGLRRAMLPLLAALGGMLVPALIHFAFNRGTEASRGFGIPMATDIAFCLGVLSLLGDRIPALLKVFLTALAIIDDLGAILVIALFYSGEMEWSYLTIAVIIFSLMLVMNRSKVYKVWIYLVMGALLWYCLYRTGVHPTISGVLLAFAIPFGSGDEFSLSYKLQSRLHKPVAFLILPLFALANTALVIPVTFMSELVSLNSLGIILGLFIGKPVGIFVFSMLGLRAGICEMPADLGKRHLLGAGILAGIGFTMSVFITMLAFNGSLLSDSSRIAIIFASTLSGIMGYLVLKSVSVVRGEDKPEDRIN